MPSPLGSVSDSLRALPAAELTILLASDDRHAAGELRELLLGHGYCVASTSSAREVMSLACGDVPPQLMIIDSSLPDAEGSHLCQQLAQHSASAGIPVILLSDMQRPDIIRRSRRGGCHYQVRRSYDAASMLMLIERTVGECRALAVS